MTDNQLQRAHDALRACADRIDDTDDLDDDEMRARGMLIQLCRFLATWYEQKGDANDDQ
jgi:hypothetical protein